MVRSWICSSNGTLQYPALASSLLKYLAPTGAGFIYSSVCVLWGHRLIDSLSFLVSRYMRRLPLHFVLYTMLEHQSVCSLTLGIMLISFIFFSCASMFGFRLTLHFLGRSMWGSVSCFSIIYAGSLNFPTVSNCVGYRTLRSSTVTSGFDFVVLSRVSTWQLIVTILRTSHVGSPSTTGPGTSTT